MKRKVAVLLALVMALASSVTVFGADVFADIDQAAWEDAKGYINRAYSDGFMVGEIDKNGNRIFRPNDDVSYVEVAQLIYALEGEDVDGDVANKWIGEMRENNIPQWAYNAVAFCLENNVITRANMAVFVNTDGSNRSATREDVAYIMGRYLEMMGFEADSSAVKFNDTISSICKPYVDILSSNGIMVGDNKGNFNPNKTITRTEMAIVVTSMDTLIRTTKDLVAQNSVLPTYSGYITHITKTSIMLYDEEGKGQVIDIGKGYGLNFYFNNEKVFDYEIYNLCNYGVMLSADIFTNSNGYAMDIYTTRADIKGKISGISERMYDEDTDTYLITAVNITQDNGLSRSYVLTNQTKLYYDGDFIYIDDLQELLDKYLSSYDGTIDEDDEYPHYLPLYGDAEVSYYDEYDVYPQVQIVELKLYNIMLDTGIVSLFENTAIKVLDEDGTEYTYKYADNIRFELNGKNVRTSDFRKGIEAGLTTVTLQYDTEGYVTKITAKTK